MEISDEVKVAYRKARHWQEIDYVPTANARNATNKEVYLLLADALRDTLAQLKEMQFRRDHYECVFDDCMSGESYRQRHKWTFAQWQQFADDELK